VNTLYFEDVEEGAELPPLVKRPTTRQLVKWAGAIGDYAEIHYDLREAHAAKLDDLVVHGALKSAFLGQLVTDWIGPKGTVQKLTASFRGMDAPGHTLTCKGRVSRKTASTGQGTVECELWIENEEAKVTTTGSAVVVLPLGRPTGLSGE
jgi:acyl dehydratase